MGFLWELVGGCEETRRERRRKHALSAAQAVHGHYLGVQDDTGISHQIEM